MAEILKARDLSRPEHPIVAVKRILPHLTEDRQYVTMFLDESRVLAQLEHENIIRTLEVGQVGETPFIAIEYVFGQDARMLFHRSRRSEQPIPVPVASFIITQVCAALHHAHEAEDAYGNTLGLVHRDVSLQNVLLSYDGAVKLTDFGIAMSATNRARTEAGIVKGKFGYMSPEQIKGETMDRRSDVFATGICLYELLTCERLFSGETDYAAIEKVRSASIAPPSQLNREIPSGLEAIVMKALARQPRDRYQTAADLRRALLAFMAESAGECSAKDLAECMRARFADELRKRPTPATLIRDEKQQPQRDAATGLAAFDDLDPVSALTSASEVHDASAIIAGHAHAQHAEHPSAPPGLEWDEEENATASAVPDAAEGFGSSPYVEDEQHDDEVTRQLYVGETFSGLSNAPSASGVRLASVPPPAPVYTPSPVPAPSPSIFPSTEDRSPIYTPPQTSYSVVVGIVVAIVAVIAAALYATRGGRVAEVVLSTVPADAFVRIDGKLPVGSSPFEVTSGVAHDLEVSKPGHRAWSTRLTLAPGQVMRLPLITLEKVQPPAAPATANEEPAAASAAAAAALPAAAVVAPAQPAADVADKAEAPPARTGNRARRPRARVRRRSAATSSAAPRAQAAAPSQAAAPAAGSGVLRLNSRPWSEVSIDGRPIGNTPLMNVTLSAGSHRVVLRNPQFGLEKSLKITIAAGQVVTRVIELQ
jgi:serine/threonine protein kinase